METVDLSRGIPWTFRWLIQSLAERLPRSMLVTMLQETRMPRGKKSGHPR